LIIIIWNLNATNCFSASDMVFNFHSDASYLNSPNSRSRIDGHFFLGWLPRYNYPFRLTSAIHLISTILKFVAASAAKAELGALLVNAKEGRVICLILQELLGHPQPPTPIYCDNSTAAGIANNTVKRQRSHQWKCDTSGLLSKSPTNNSTSTGTLDKKIWATTIPNTTQRHTTSMSAPITCKSQAAH
jgi:hypothetical protein